MHLNKNNLVNVEFDVLGKYIKNFIKWVKEIFPKLLKF
jgi:riboflavin synthase alpha subunit